VEARLPAVFLAALRQVFAESGIPVARVTRAPAVPGCRLAALVGVSGDARGHVALCAGAPTADRLLRLLSGGRAPSAARRAELVRAALGEIANQVAGRAVTLLAASGRRCDITSPLVVPDGRAVAFPPGPPLAWSVRGAFGTLRLLVVHERSAPRTRTAKRRKSS
jgi:CheY-specific phosphatase CheX